MSVADRGEPMASCSEWHGDGTAGEHDRASHLIVEAQARPMGEARPGRYEPRWQGPEVRGSSLGEGFEPSAGLLRRPAVVVTRWEP